jgi:hypothetical protein
LGTVWFWHFDIACNFNIDQVASAARRRRIAVELSSGDVVMVCGGRVSADRNAVFGAMDRAHATSNHAAGAALFSS